MRAREPPSEKPKDQQWVSRLGGALTLQKLPSIMKNNLFDHLHTSRAPDPMLAKQRRRPNANHDPNRSKSHLIIGDLKMSAALTRREQLPEPEQNTSDNHRSLKTNKKSLQEAREPPSDPRTRPLFLKASGPQEAEAEYAKREHFR